MPSRKATRNTRVRAWFTTGFGNQAGAHGHRQRLFVESVVQIAARLDGAGHRHFDLG
jgi:hypothetical protein